VENFVSSTAVLYLPQDDGSEPFCCDGAVGATPYTFFLKVLCVNKQLASSDFTVRKK
jgi:hypothetical protein